MSHIHTSSCRNSGEPSQLKILCLRDVQRWLAEESAAAQTCCVSEKQLLCCLVPNPELRMCDLYKTDGRLQRRRKTEHEDRYQMYSTDSQQLLVSAEQPASSTVEQSAIMDTSDGVDDDNDAMLTRLKARQRKRARLK